MSLRDDLAALLARYDDDAWVALTNRGLLRRATKDLATAELAVAAESDDAVEVLVGDRRVRFPAAGPAEATCTCPSPVLCQHVVTAGLWLAASAAAPAGSGPDDHSAPAAPADPADRQVDALHDDLMALDEAELRAHAGLAGLRWAHQFLADLDERPVLARAGYLSVTFTHPELVARYAGGGLDGIVLDQRVSAPPRYRVAAVLAWQRGHGRELEPPAPPARRAGGTELGRSRDDSRARLRGVVRAMLADSVRIGVTHPSPALQERFTTAAVWAQGAEYHRLALLLRRLADQVDLLLARSAAADDVRLLDDLALALGLVTALDAAAARGDAPAALVGRARASYDTVRSLDLVGLGGLPWRSGSGYHGLTCVFWSSDRARFLTWTDARPVDLAGFDPRARWTQPAPWQGLSSPSTSAGRLLHLTGARLSSDDRLSGVESTTAAVAPVDGEDLLARLPVLDRFEDLRDGGSRGLLTGGGRGQPWAVLRPASFGEPAFDQARQVLSRAVLDAEGTPVVLELPWAGHLAHAIGRLESLVAPAPGAAVVARVRSVRGRLVGEPLSLVLPDRPVTPVDALHFDPGPASALVAALRDRPDATDGGRSPDEPDAPAHEAPAVVPRPLAELRAGLERQAQRGTSGAPPDGVRAELGRRHQALRDAGLTVFGPPDPAVDPAEALLRSHYLLLQCEAVLA